jgi:hypothetical protein
MRSFAMPGLSHHTESVESLNKALGLEGHAVVRIAGTVRSGMLSGYCPRFESLAMAFISLDRTMSEEPTATFISDASVADLRSSSQGESFGL